MDFFDKLSETLLNAGKDVGQKAKDLSDAARMTMDIRTKEDQVQKMYTAMGKAYYEAHKDDADTEDISVTQVTEALAEIEKMKKDLLSLKGVIVCPACNAEIQAEDAYCKKCGVKIEKEETVAEEECTEECAEECTEECASEACDCEKEEVAEEKDAINTVTTEEVFED